VHVGHGLEHYGSGKGRGKEREHCESWHMVTLAAYWTAMVTPLCDGTLPRLSTMGTAGAEGTPCGTTALTLLRHTNSRHLNQPRRCSTLVLYTSGSDTLIGKINHLLSICWSDSSTLPP